MLCVGLVGRSSATVLVMVMGSQDRYLKLENSQFRPRHAGYSVVWPLFAIRSFAWHKDQQAVCDCMTAVICLAES